MAEPIEMPFRMWTSGLRWEPRSPWEGLFRGGGLYLGIPKLACGQPNYEHCTECQARLELEDFVGAEFYYS